MGGHQKTARHCRYPPRSGLCGRETGISIKVLAESLLRLGEYVASNGIEGKGPYQPARDLLLRIAPRLNGLAIRHEGETALDAALRIAPAFGWFGNADIDLQLKQFGTSRVIIVARTFGYRRNPIASSYARRTTSG